MYKASEYPPIARGITREEYSKAVRAAVQAVCLAMFVYLALAAQLQWQSLLPHDLFLRLDPLVWLVATAAAREVAVYGWCALALVVVTALFGRVSCGWVCPLGTAMDAARLVRSRTTGGLPIKRLSNVRFWVLVALIGAAMVGVNFARWLERCVICLDACPSNYTAIELRPTPTGLFHPHVKKSRCTGCGVCEYQCPLEGEAAIRVVAANEITVIRKT